MKKIMIKRMKSDEEANTLPDEDCDIDNAPSNKMKQTEGNRQSKAKPVKGVVNEVLSLTSEEGRDFLSKIKETCLDPIHNERFWRIESVQRIRNTTLEKKYEDKRKADLVSKQDGQEIFVFSVESQKLCKEIANEGYRVGLKRKHILGYADSGVHLVRHYDILTRYMAYQLFTGTQKIIVSKAFLGKAKAVEPYMLQNDNYHSPDSRYDCHYSARTTHQSMLILDAISCSYMYFYELDPVSSNNVKHPRQILPFAVMTLTKKPRVRPIEPFLAVDTGDVHTGWEVSGETRHGFRFKYNKSTQHFVESRSPMIKQLKQDRHKLNRRLGKFQKQPSVEDISADDKSSLLQIRDNIEHLSKLQQLKMNDPDASKCNLTESQRSINANQNTKDNTSDEENCASNINNVEMITLSKNLEKSKGITIVFNGKIYDVSIPPFDRTVYVKHADCSCTPKIGMCMAQLRAHSAPYITKGRQSYSSKYENKVGAVTKSKPTQNKLTASRGKFQNRVCKYLPISYTPFVLLNDVHRVDTTKARLTHFSQEVNEKHINKDKVIHSDSLLSVSEINKQSLANTTQTLNNALITNSVSKLIYSTEVKQFQLQNVTHQVIPNTPELHDKAQCNESVQFVSERASKQNRSNETSNRVVTGGSKLETISGDKSKVSSCMEKKEERKHNDRHGTTNQQNVPTSHTMLQTSAETSTLISNVTKTNIEGTSHTEHVGLTENVSQYHNEIQSRIQLDQQKSDNAELTLAIADNDTVVQQKLANTTHMIDQTPAPIHLLSHNTCERTKNPSNRYVTDSKEYCTDNYVNKTETSSIVEASSASDSYDNIVTTTFHNSIPDSSDEKQSAITVTIEPDVKTQIRPINDAECIGTNNLNVGTVYVGDKRNDMHVAPEAATIGFLKVVPTHIDFGQKADDVCVMAASYNTQENKQMLLKCLSDRKRLNKKKMRSKDTCLSLHDDFTQQIHALDFSKSKRNQNPNYPKPIDSDPKVLPKDTRNFRLNPAEITNEPLNLTQESFIRDKQTHSFHNIEANACHSRGSTSDRNITSNIAARSHLENDIMPTITDDQQAIVNANEAADRWEMTKTAIADISRSTDCAKSELTVSPRLSDPLMFQTNDPCSIPSFEHITSHTHDSGIPIGSHTMNANLTNVFTHNVITSRVPISTHTCNGTTPSNSSNSSPRLISSLVQYRFPSPSQSPIQSPSPVPCHAMNVGMNIRHPHIATVPTIPYPMHLGLCQVTSTHMSVNTTVCTSTVSTSTHVGLGNVMHSNNMEAISGSGVTSHSTLDGYRGVVGGDKSNTKVDVETAKRLQKFLLKSISAVKKQTLLGISNGTHNSGRNDSDAFSQANYSFSNLPTIVTSLDNSFEKPLTTKLTEVSSPTFVSENNHCSPNTNTSLSADIISETFNECRNKLSPFPITETKESFSGTSENSPLTTVNENIEVPRSLSVNQEMIDTTQCNFSQISELQTLLPVEEDTFLRNYGNPTQTSATEESFSQIGKAPILKSINGHSFSMHPEEIEQIKIEEQSESMITSDYVREHPSELDVMPILYNETESIDENVYSFQNFPDPPNIHDDDSQETVIGGISLATYRNNAHYPKLSELISVVENGSLDIINTVKIHKRRCTQFNKHTSKQISISANRQKSTAKKKVIKTAIAKKLSTKLKRYKYRQSLKHKGRRFKHRTFNTASKCEHDIDINNCVDQPDFTALKEFSSIANMVANSTSGSVTIEDILTSTNSNGISNASITNSDDGNTHLPNLAVKHPDLKTQMPLVCHSSSAAIPIQHTSELSQSSDQQLNDACENKDNIHIHMSLNDNINESSSWRRVNTCKLPASRKESDINKLQGQSNVYAETENTIDHEHINTRDSNGVCKHETVQTITALCMEDQTFENTYSISNIQTNTNQQISGSLRNRTLVNDYTSDTVTSLGSCTLPVDVTATVTDINKVTDFLKTPDSLSSMETKQIRQMSELTNRNIDLDVSLYDTVDVRPGESGVNTDTSKASENKTCSTVAIEIHNSVDNKNKKNKAVENYLNKINSNKCEIQCHVPSDNLRNVDINSYAKYSKSNPTQLVATNDTLPNSNTVQETNTELEQANTSMTPNNTYISMHNDQVDTNNTKRKQTSNGTINLKAIKETLSLPQWENNALLPTSIKHRRRDIPYDIGPIIQSNCEKSRYMVETARVDSRNITKAVKPEYEDDRWLDKTISTNVTVLPHSESHRYKASVSSSNYSDIHTSRYYRKRHRHSLSDYKYRDNRVLKDKSDNVQNTSDKGVYSPKEKNASNPANVRSSSFPINSEKTSKSVHNQSVGKSDEQRTSYKARHVDRSHSNVKDNNIKRTARGIQSFEEIMAEKKDRYDRWKRSRKWKTIATSDGDPFRQKRHTHMCNTTLRTDDERTRRNICDCDNSEYGRKRRENNERVLTRITKYDKKSRLFSPGDDLVDFGKRNSFHKAVDTHNKDKEQRKSGDTTQWRSSKFGSDMSTFSKGSLSCDASYNGTIKTEKDVLSRTQDCVSTLNTSICEPNSGKSKTYIESNSLFVSSNDTTYYQNKKQMDRKTHVGKFTFKQEDDTSVPDKERCRVSRSNEVFVDKGFDASNYKVDDSYPFRQIRNKHYSYQSRKMVPTRKNGFQKRGTGYFQWRKKYCRQGLSSLQNEHNDEIQEGKMNGRTRETLCKQKLVFRKECDNYLGDNKIARHIAELRRLIRQRQNQTLHKDNRRVLVELEMLSRNTNPGKYQRIAKRKLKRKVRAAKQNRHLKREEKIILNCLNVQSKGRQRTGSISWIIQKADNIKDIFIEDLRQQCDQVTEPFKRGMSNQSVGNSLVQNISTELSYPEPRTNITINSRKNYDNEIEPCSRVADHKHVYNKRRTSSSDCLSSSENIGVSKHSAQNSAISQRGWCHRHCALETNGVNVANEPDDPRRSRSEDRYISFYRHAKEHNNVPYKRRSWSPEHIEIKHGIDSSHRRSDVCGPNGNTYDHIHYGVDSRNSNKYRPNRYNIRSESASSFMWDNKDVNNDGSQFRQHCSPDQEFRQSKSNKWTHVDDARDKIEPYDTYCRRYKLYRPRRLNKHHHYSNKHNSDDSEYPYSGRNDSERVNIIEEKYHDNMCET